MTRTDRRQPQNFSLHAGKGRRLLCGALWAGMFAALLFAVSPSYAGPLDDTVDRIEKKVNDIQGKVNTARNRIVGLTDRVNGIVGDVGGSTLNDVQAALQDAKALLDFAKSQAADALGNRGNHPDVVALFTGIEDLLKALMGDAGNNVNLGVLTQLLAILPDQVLAVAGQGLLTVGIDQAFVAKIQQAVSDVALLQQALDSDNPATNSSNLVQSTTSQFLTGGTNCTFVNEHRIAIKGARYFLLGAGNSWKLGGKVIAAKSKTVASGQVFDVINVGIHGYAALNIENDMNSALGKVIEGIGDVLLTASNSGSDMLSNCERLLYQQSLLDATCRLSRGAGVVCQRWVGSSEQDALRNRSQ